MGLLDALIATSCMGLAGQQNEACEKALQAGSKQSGFDQMANGYENNQLKYLQDNANYFIGKDKIETIGAIGWLTKAAVERKAAVGLTRTLSLVFDMKTGQLVIRWSF